MTPQPVLAEYSFLPWLRKGIASSIKNRDNPGENAGPLRASVNIKVRVDVDPGNPVAREIVLIGPGDVLGFSHRGIVRTDPKPWSTDFEPNYLPFIEFYDEDFPWRYTPAKPAVNDRLRPWIALAILAEDEFISESEPRVQSGQAKVLRITKNPAEILPPPEQLWAWAHVHVNESIGHEGDIDPQILDRLKHLAESDPDRVFSRLLCPRRLRPNTHYHAFVIPTFEAGRKTGLQIAPLNEDGLKAAWSDDPATSADNPFETPYYFDFEFRTTEKGDFEYLVRLLEPRVLPPEVGIRDMDVRDVGYRLPGEPQLEKLVGLEGALRTVSTEPRPWPNPVAIVNPDSVWFTRIREVINLPQETVPDDGEDLQDTLPLVVPPLYGKWHANVRQLENSNPPWINELNQDIRNRAAAGLGVAVIRKEQENLMDSAWEQVGDVTEANRLQIRAQFAEAMNLSVYRGYLNRLPAANLLEVTAPLLGRVLASKTTIRSKIKESLVPEAMLTTTFRRAAAIERPLIKGRKTPTRQPRRHPLERINGEEGFKPAPQKRAPGNVRILEKISDSLLPKGLPDWFRRRAYRAPEVSFGATLAAAGLNAVLPFASFASPLFLGGLAVGTGLGVVGVTRRSKWRTGALFRRDSLTPELIESAKFPRDFKLTLTDRNKPLHPVDPGVDSGGRLQKAFSQAHKRFQSVSRRTEKREALSLEGLRVKILERTEPRAALMERMQKTVTAVGGSGNQVLAQKDSLDTIMAAPSFDRPMYETLRDLGSEYLIPNLNLIPPNTISIIETNFLFIESFMLGLCHEMSRELLWREYPTDRRGTYFRQFWDVSDVKVSDPGLSEAEVRNQLRDINPIHTWDKHSSSRLGSHNARAGSQPKENLVLAVRGDLLKRYPTAVIYAVEAGIGADGNRTTMDGGVEKYPIFHARVEPDIYFIGFDLTEEDVRHGGSESEGWYFVIRERPGEPRFGLDLGSGQAPQPIEKWDDLTWRHLAASEDELLRLEFINVADSPTDFHDSVTWGDHSAAMAKIMYQAPVMVAIHAEEMLPKKPG